MVLSPLMTTGLAIGGGGTLLYTLKSVPATIWGLIKNKIFWSVTIYEKDPLFHIIERFVAKNYDKKILYTEGFLAPEGHEDRVIYTQMENFLTIRSENKKLYIRKIREKLDKAENKNDMFMQHFSITGLRAKVQIKNFLDRIVKESESEKIKDSVAIYIMDEYYSSSWYFSKRTAVKTWDTVFLDQDIKDKLLSEMNSFNSSKEWYLKRGISHKQGLLFYGPPGNGKTTLALALAEKYKKKVYMMNLKSLGSDNRASRYMASVEPNSIVLIEDIDAIFHGREAQPDVKISFSCLLAMLDGVYSQPGVTVILTTNHLELLDPALIREGRMDLKFEIKNPNEGVIKHYVSNFYNKQLNGQIMPQEISMAKVQTVCMSHKESFENALEELQTLN